MLEKTKKLLNILSREENSGRSSDETGNRTLKLLKKLKVSRDKAHMRRKYFKITHLIKDLHVGHIKNSQNSARKQFKKGQKISIGILSKKIYRWQISP